MKKVFGLLALIILLNSCDDGNLIQEDIEFEDATTQNCTTNNIIYKLKDKESLILEIPESSFTNEPTENGSPTVIDINTTNRVVYRFYNGTVSSDNICETIPPATPFVTDQWTAESGTIEINTTAIKTANTTNNSTKISGYNHAIVFKNITFQKNNGKQVYETFPFGDYITSATNLPFLFDETVEQCNNSNEIYNYTSNEALTLDIDPSLLTTTELNTPKTGLISSTVNKITYRLYTGLLTASYFCQTELPETPEINEQWDAIDGVSNLSGTVEVTTTTNGTGFKHTIILKKVSLKKGNSDFLLGDNYLFGELLTN